MKNVCMKAIFFCLVITMSVVSSLESGHGGGHRGGMSRGGGRSFSGHSGYNHGGGNRHWGNQNYYGRRGYGAGGAILGAELGVLGASAALNDDGYYYNQDEDPGYYNVINEERWN